MNIGILRISGTLKTNPLVHHVDCIFAFLILIFFFTDCVYGSHSKQQLFFILPWMSLAFEALNMYCKLGNHLFNTRIHKMHSSRDWLMLKLKIYFKWITGYLSLMKASHDECDRKLRCETHFTANYSFLNSMSYVELILCFNRSFCENEKHVFYNLNSVTIICL